jgi:cytochrome P450
MIHRLRTTGQGPELARLLLEHRDNEAMTEDELVAMYLLILFGGSETTTNLLGNGFAALQRNRDQWDLLVEDPTLVRGAVEELIRYDSPHHYLPRAVEEDFRLHDVELKAGPDGDHHHGCGEPRRGRLRPARRPGRAAARTSRTTCRSRSAPTTVSGAALARIEGEIVFSTLAQRSPKLGCSPTT